MGTWAGNRPSSIFQAGAGRSPGLVTRSTKREGSHGRRKRGGSTLGEVTRKVRALERARDEGDKVPTGRSPRLEDWLEEWRTASALRVRPSSLYGYSPDVRTPLGPRNGENRLEPHPPNNIDCPYTTLTATGHN